MATQVAFGIGDEFPAYNQQPQECSREHGKVVMSVVKYPRITLGLGLAAALFVTTVTASQRQAAAMATAANAFLAGLTPEQRQQAALPFEGEERMRWNFIPNEMFPRKGLMVKSMSEAQRAQAHALLKTGLSQKGYMTATSIMDLENVLRAIEAAGGGDSRGGPPRFARDPLEYYFSVFGTPSSTGRMGLACGRPSRLAAFHRSRTGKRLRALRPSSARTPRTYSTARRRA